MGIKMIKPMYPEAKEGERPLGAEVEQSGSDNLSFRKRFPSLNIKVRSPEPELLIYSMWTIEQLLKDVDKCCLDKKTVKKAIEELFTKWKDNAGDTAYVYDFQKEELLKRLGVENGE